MLDTMTETASPLAGRRILIVEDDFLTADEIWTALEARGARIVAAAASVRKALAVLESTDAVDAAVVDINLDGEMAYPVVDALIARDRPVVFTTVYRKDQLPDRYRSIPHCAKPMQAPDLLREMQRALNVESVPRARSRSDAADAVGSWILAIARGGDRSAFEQLFLAVAPQIKAYMLRVGVASWIAEGLALDAMLRVWREAGWFDPSRSTGLGWIYTIARDLRVDLLREPRDGYASSAREQAEEQADVLELLFIHGRPPDQIARSLGVPAEMVKSRVDRAIAKQRSGSGHAG